MAGLKPVAMDVEEAVVGPVARGDEEDQEENGAVDTWPIKEIREEEECDYESSGQSASVRSPRRVCTLERD